MVTTEAGECNQLQRLPPVLDVVVTDPIISRFADRLMTGAPDHRWHFVADAAPEESFPAMTTADVVVCSRLDSRQAAACGARLVQVTGAGLDRVAVGALPAETAVTNTFHHERPIAEHVLMCILALTRRLPSVSGELRHGTWRTIATDGHVPLHRTLDTMTLGLVGFGGIGSATASLAHAVGMEVVAVRNRPDVPVPDGTCPRWVGGISELPRLLAESDVVVITVPLSPATEGMIGSAELAAMREDALLINVARGPVVDQSALYAALRDGSIGGAAIDVWWGAPESGRTPPADFPFVDLPNVLATPHYSGHARSTFELRADDIAENVNRLAQGQALRNRVR
ncbi:2-hydroxyacid dehydrogenase [Arthrobacter sp.]|uniref:2-hydroxyacid dehydrogenase n=1 Tax=Arthrobacter sp. TaxID=1667 RepID=UPI0028115784|nr:2-hydroxyacid dehydrogenase [Arthrobacter sp.]